MDSSVHYARAADGVNIAYATRGEGIAQLAVFGWISHLELVLDWYPRPIDGVQQVFFDKRGTGLSDRQVGSYSVQHRKLDVEAVVDAAGLESFVLSGTSEGGPVAIAYAADHPERVRRMRRGIPACHSRGVR